MREYYLSISSSNVGLKKNSKYFLIIYFKFFFIDMTNKASWVRFRLCKSGLQVNRDMGQLDCGLDWIKLANVFQPNFFFSFNFTKINK